MRIEFTKMHGIANDYIYINCMGKDDLGFDPCELAREMSPRHFSVGSDGVVLICDSSVADAKMRMFNLDGSEGKMCGNAIRCVGKYLYDNGICSNTELSIETLSGIKYLKLTVADGKVSAVSVDMGTACFVPRDIPVISDGEMVSAPVSVNGSEWKITAVSMGNPHAVIFTDNVEQLELEKIGPDFENLEIFPERVNTEFVKVVDSTHLVMRVWERGSGETWACGTGACATVAAAVKNGISPPDTDVSVMLRGGELTIKCASDYKIRMTGAAKKVYDGVYEYDKD